MTARLLEERLEGMVMDWRRRSAMESLGEGETGLLMEEEGSLVVGEVVREDVSWWPREQGSTFRSR